MGWFDDLGSWIGDNKSWLQPVANAGFSAYQQSQKDDTQSQYMDYLRSQEDRNYANSKAAYDAQVAYMGQAAAAARANAAARASAAAATERNRQIAAGKANKNTQETYKKVAAMYQPYADTALKLLPEMTGTYESGLNTINALNAYLNSPKQQAKLSASIPASDVLVNLPDYLRR